MKFDVLTIFPELIEAIVSSSVLGKAAEGRKVEYNVHDLRKWTDDQRRTVDDKPFGGNPGMLLKVEPVYKALKELGVYPTRPSTTKVVLTSASGKMWSQDTAINWATNTEHIVLICGRYEGFDHRVVKMVDAEISVGNYVLTGGELPAGIIIDSISRLIPGVLGNSASLQDESFTGIRDEEIPEYPQYTRPAIFTTEEGEDWIVPEVLLSGNPAAIKDWQQEQSLIKQKDQTK